MGNDDTRTDVLKILECFLHAARCRCVMHLKKRNEETGLFTNPVANMLCKHSNSSLWLIAESWSSKTIFFVEGWLFPVPTIVNRHVWPFFQQIWRRSKNPWDPSQIFQDWFNGTR